MFKRLFGGFLATIVLVLGGISNTVIATGGQIASETLVDESTFSSRVKRRFLTGEKRRVKKNIGLLAKPY